MIQSKLFAFLETNSPCDVLLCEDDKEAKSLQQVGEYFQKEVIVFPDFRATFGDDLRPYKEELTQLFHALRSYYQAKNPLVIAPLRSVIFPLPKKELLQTKTLSFGDNIDLKSLQQQLLVWGYDFVDIVQTEAEVSFRGDIIDIFPPKATHPYRISLFDTEIEQIKPFDLQTQKTLKDEQESITIPSAYFSLSNDAYEEMMEKITQSPHDLLSKDIASLGFWYLDKFATNFLTNKTVYAIKDLTTLLEEVYVISMPTIKKETFSSLKVLEEKDGYFDIVAINPKKLLQAHHTKKATILAQNEAILKQHDLFIQDNFTYKQSPLIVNVVTPNEIIISLNKEEKRQRKKRPALLLDELKKGDYVVHQEYGVGIFQGIQQAEILGGIKDFVVISYLGDDKVMLPVENLEMIDRYIAASGTLPTLDKLGKGSFAKLKESVRKKLFEIAAKIVNLAAKRELIKAPIINIDHVSLKHFQNNAGFKYTNDQQKAIDAILHDLQSGKVMDRLLSGDVGFGKTEVAMNAIFAVAKAKKQSAFIVPTTLLSSQHYKTLQERFANENIKVAKFDRFVSTKEKTAIKKALKEGTIDCVVGTHAVFNLEFKDLALVIVDEEHKFGVKQKEKIKELYHNVHMLSMSATPIPRSLNQALSKIKTLSELLTPPKDRQDVRTFVKEWDEKLIKEVILRELRRGGQVFYIHNSIEQIPFKQRELEAILPQIRIVALHSKINAVQTEKELLKFENKEYDLLLSTSIVESGIHMPNVNTIIVDGANRFGIADLHQLRGRVGRSSKEGFAYFLVDDKEKLSDEAKKRLLALESNSYLGSGSVLAHHDLEIRGGGNLLGDAQSGHIKNIGYSLYLKMLEDALAELTNTPKEKEHKIDIKLTISAYISSDIVSEDRLRIDLYRRLAQAKEVFDIYAIEEEIIDRFGDIDTPTKQFISLVVIKLLASKANIKTIMNYGQNITIIFDDNTKEILKSPSKDDDDILETLLKYLRKKSS